MSILEEIIIIVGVAVASASLLLFMYSYITTKRHQLVLEDRKLEFEYRTRDYELSSRLAHSDSENVSPSLVSELLSRQDALLNRLESITYSPKALADSVSRLNAIVDLLQAQEEKPQQQQQELLARLDRLTAGIPTREEHAPDELASQEEHVAFIRELAHSLNTPLSQIEAAALLLQEAPKQESTATASSRSPASRIYQSAEICKAFLSAFMQITKVASQTSKWNPKSLEESLAAAAELYAERSEAHTS